MSLSSSAPLNIFVVNINNVDKPSLALFSSVLDKEEKNRLLNMKHRIVQERFITGRGLLRTILANKLSCKPENVSIKVEKNGKPVLSCNSIQFNVAHSGNYIVLAIGECEHLGIDVEQVIQKPNLLAIAQASFPEQACQKLESIQGEEQLNQFYKNWTLFEAFIKAKGYGVFSKLTDVEQTLLNRIILNSDMQQDSWQQYHQVLPGNYHLGLVASGLSQSMMDSLKIVEWLPEQINNVVSA
jgi:4'-phosphopantetheinyl transferase